MSWWTDLEDFQQEALQKMHNGCILHGGVGSGKSRVSLCYYYSRLHGGIDKADKDDISVKLVNPMDLYIITTAKKRDSLEWILEMCSVCMGPNEQCEKMWGIHFHVDSWNNISRYEDVKGAFFIFDEQRAAGAGKWAKMFIKISKKNEWILLTATPGDTWIDYIPVFIANGFYRNRSEFIAEHVIYKPFRRYNAVDRYLNTRKLERLRDKILVDMNRPIELVKIEEFIICEYDRELYKQVMKYKTDPWTGEPLMSATSLSYTLRKVVNTHPSRAEQLLRLFDKHGRLIVFYSFDYERDILLGLNYGERALVREWNGHAHQEVPTEGQWVYLVQYTAGCEGWNCVLTNATAFYSEQYSYKAFEQAKGRIDRMNSPFRTLYYYVLRSRAPIDIGIARAIATKKNFNAQRFFSGECWKT